MLLIVLAALIVGVFGLVHYQSTIQHLLIIFSLLVMVINLGRGILLLKNFIKEKIKDHH